jgi:tartrate dehydratase alpha subunit/fumarate hydratase class I-like protein
LHSISNLIILISRNHHHSATLLLANAIINCWTGRRMLVKLIYQ